jgi:hypothetical protein
MSPFWLIWMIFLFMFLLTPIGYGWGYRGWGMPYPRYVQRRRASRAVASGLSHDHYAWGLAGDFVWAGVLIAVMWAVSALVWLR